MDTENKLINQLTFYVINNDFEALGGALIRFFDRNPKYKTNEEMELKLEELHRNVQARVGDCEH